MADMLWGVWVRLRVGSAKLQRWAFTIGKWAALAFILLYVLGFMAASTLEGLGYAEFARPMLEVIRWVNAEVHSFVTGL